MYNVYDNISQQVLQRYVAKGKGKSNVCNFKRGIRDFREYLEENKLSYSPQIAADWLESIRLYSSINHSVYKIMRYAQYLIALEFSPNTIDKSMFYKNIIAYSEKLPNWASVILESYISYLPNNTKAWFKKDASKLLYYMYEQGCKTIKDLSCEILCKYRKEEFNHSTQRFLDFLYEKGYIDIFTKETYNSYHLEKLDGFRKYISKLPVSMVPFDDYCKAIKTYIKQLEDLKYSNTVIKDSVHYCIDFGICMKLYKFNYSYESVNIYASYLKNELGRHILPLKKILLSIDYILSDKPVPNVLNNQKNKFPTWFEHYEKNYREFRTKNHLSKSSLNMDRSVLLRFSKYLCNKGICNIKEISIKDIKDFCLQDEHSTLESKAAYIVRLKMFLEFLEDSHTIDIPLSKSLPIINTTKVRPTESIDDISYNQILDHCKKWELEGEYLKPLLVKIELWTALRPSDITILTFDNIDFENRLFKLCQRKTNNYLSVPFPNDIGNLLYDYITKQRPKLIKSQFVFIQNRAPFNHYNRYIVRSALISATNGKITKSHLLRKTLATRMLRTESSVSEISNVLGHLSNNTVDPYIDTNADMMRLCGISIKAIDRSM